MKPCILLLLPIDAQVDINFFACQFQRSLHTQIIILMEKNHIRLIAHGCWFHPLQESRQRKLFVDGINGDHSTFTPTIINSVTNEDKDEDKDKNEEE